MYLILLASKLLCKITLKLLSIQLIFNNDYIEYSFVSLLINKFIKEIVLSLI